MKINKFHMVFFIIITTALSFIYLFRVGWYPLALLNSDIIWGWELENEYQSTAYYYDKAVATYNFKKIYKDDLRRAAFDSLVEKKIIGNGFKETIGVDGDRLVIDKINVYLNDQKLRAAAAALFNLSGDEFKELILIPQAQRDVLTEKLEEEGRDFNNWLELKKGKASIYFFSNEFIWDGRDIVKN